MRRIPQFALGVVCVVFAVAGWPTQVTAQDIVCDAVGSREIKALQFQGNQAVPSSDLEVRILATESSWLRRHAGVLGTKHCLDEAELPRDVLRLKAYYKQKGYYNAKVETRVQPAGKNAVHLAFLIQEGAPIILDSLTISGLDSVPHAKQIVAGLGLKVGNAFDLSLYQADIDTIISRLHNDGYPSADYIERGREVNYDSLRAKVALLILPGRRRYIGEIRVTVTPYDSSGAQQISSARVRSLLGIRPGDVYSDDRLVIAQRNLYQLGAYRHVDVRVIADSLQPKNDSLIGLAVDLREDAMREITTQYGWATLDCAHTQAQYTDRNFLGLARRLELTGQLSKLGYGYPLASKFTRQLCDQSLLNKDPFSDTTNYSISAALREPVQFGGGWSESYSLYRERRSEFQAYLRTTLIGGEVAATKDVSANGVLRLAYNLEYGRTQAQPALLCAVFSRCDQQSQDQLSLVSQPLAVASAQYVLSRTDNAFNPTRGFIWRSELRSSLPFLGSASDLTFNKGTVDASWYLPVSRNSVFAMRLRGGLILDGNLSLTNATQFIPPQERLYAGGANSVRGFQQNELGGLIYIAQNIDSSTVVDDSTKNFRTQNGVKPFRVVPVGGNASVVTNFEYRVADVFFPQLIQYTFFTDGGEVWTRGTPGTGLSLSHMVWTPGIGIRVFTAVGPLQVNVAYNPYAAVPGPIYYDASVNTTTAEAPLYCVSPGNTIPTRVNTMQGGIRTQAQQACPATFVPAQSGSFFRRLTFTFSVGPGF